jgi:protein involved in polysaccharide export with SLBB domain
MVAQAEQAAANAAGDAGLRTRKQAEAEMLRSRLRDGDFNVGDRIYVEMRGGQEPFADTVTVRPGRVISLPDMPDISLQGVLRSELQDHLTREVGRYIRNPDVRARTFIRVAVLGAIGKQGFYTFPADMLFTDAIMQAGGPREDTNLEDVQVRRSTRVVLAKEDSQQAIREGWTLDQMSLRAGDEVLVGEKHEINWWRALRVASIGLSVTFLVIRLVGYFKD